MIVPRATGPTALVVAWMSGALVCFVIAALTVRGLSHSLNVVEIGAARTGIGLVVLVALLAFSPALRLQIRRSSGLLHLPRNLAHALGGIAWTIAIALLPFATVFSIEFTAPAFVALLAYPILKEKVSGRAATGIAFCFIGVLVIMRPGGSAFDAASLIAVGAAFCFALSVLLTRKLVLTQSVFAILFWMMVWQAGFYWTGLIASSSGEVLYSWRPDLAAAMALLGVAGLGSQLCLSQALRTGEAANVVSLDFLRVPIIAVIGWAFYGEPLSVWVFGGAALIMGGIVYGLMPPPRSRRPVIPHEIAAMGDAAPTSARAS